MIFSLKNSSFISLDLMALFPDYFLVLGILSTIVVTSMLPYRACGLMVQKGLSQSVSVVVIMTIFLLLNDCNYYNMLVGVVGTSQVSFSIIADPLSLFGKVTLYTLLAAYFTINSHFFKVQRLTSVEYILIVLFAVLGLSLMCNSNDLLTSYLSIELSGLSMYILASFKKDSNHSIEGGVIYFVTGAISSALFLLGSSLLYGSLGSVSFQDLYLLTDNLLWFPGRLSEDYYNYMGARPRRRLLRRVPVARIGLTLVLLSLFIKLALAPTHNWSLDVYEGSSTSSTFFFSVLAKFSYIILSIRFCYVNLYSMRYIWESYPFILGFLSVLIGSLGGLQQRRIKTIIAYSSTSHMGYLLLAFGTTIFQGIKLILLYFIVYTIGTICFWAVILLLSLRIEKNKSKYGKVLSDLVLLEKANKGLAFVLALSVFSMAGMPPMAGFLAKMSLFVLPVLRPRFDFFAMASISLGVVSTFYYLRIVKILYFEKLLSSKLYHSFLYSCTPLSVGLFSSLLVLILIVPEGLYAVCESCVFILGFLSKLFLNLNMHNPMPSLGSMLLMHFYGWVQSDPEHLYNLFIKFMKLGLDPAKRAEVFSEYVSDYYLLLKNNTTSMFSSLNYREYPEQLYLGDRVLKIPYSDWREEYHDPDRWGVPVPKPFCQTCTSCSDADSVKGMGKITERIYCEDDSVERFNLYLKFRNHPSSLTSQQILYLLEKREWQDKCCQSIDSMIRHEVESYVKEKCKFYEIRNGHKSPMTMDECIKCVFR